MRYRKLAAPLALFSVALVNGCAPEVDGEMIEQSRAYLTTMQVYLGSFHGHSAASDGSGTPSDVFNWAKSSGNFDFYILTDHAELLSNGEWNTNATVANQFNQDGVFVAMRGFEYSNPFDGHANVFETSGKKGWFLSPNSAFYNWVDSNNGIGQFNHPGDSGSFSNYAFRANVADNFTMMETANGGDRNSGRQVRRLLQHGPGQGLEARTHRQPRQPQPQRLGGAHGRARHHAQPRGHRRCHAGTAGLFRRRSVHRGAVQPGRPLDGRGRGRRRRFLHLRPERPE